MEFYYEKLYGDLTRTGNFTEHDFGWQMQRPEILSEHLKDYPMAEADILVIGDSFSVSRIWQTRLIANGLKVSTMTWQELGTDQSMRGDLGVALRAAGFKGRYVVIESIERYFQKRMKALSDAHPQIIKHEFVIKPDFAMYPFTHRERMSFNKLNGLDWGVKASYNRLKLFLNLPEIKSGAVKAISFDGCQLFSHRLCHYALFSETDFEKETFNSIANVLTVNKNLQSVDIQPIWLVVPDKTTIYLGYGKLNQNPYQNIWQQFAQYPQLIAPNLGAIFTEKSRVLKDFYMPNDTHLSTDGFLYLGDLMLKGLNNIQANPTKPFSQ